MTFEERTEQFRLGVLLASEEIKEYISKKLLDNREELDYEQGTTAQHNLRELRGERDALLAIHKFVEGISRANHSVLRFNKQTSTLQSREN